jgi:hypothetical protein
MKYKHKQEKSNKHKQASERERVIQCYQVFYRVLEYAVLYAH